MEKSKIYTKTGDKGYTSLVGGKRVPKTHPRIDAYGTVDELNSFIACLLDTVNDRDDRELLLRIQNNLFTLGAYLATEDDNKSCPVSTEEVEILENEMDRIDDVITPVKAFVLPGGSPSNSLAHVCRTVCRRVERCMYRIGEEGNIDPVALQYINRLSDYFFLLARKQSFINGISEIIWEKPCN
jgi:cob(I)alamin adenosyltransferase